MTFRSREWESTFHRRKEEPSRDTQLYKQAIRVRVKDLCYYSYIYKCIEKHLVDEHSGLDDEMYVMMGYVDRHGDSHMEMDSIRFFNGYGDQGEVTNDLTSYMHRSPEIIRKLASILDGYTLEGFTESHYRIKTDNTRNIEQIAELLAGCNQNFVFERRDKKTADLDMTVAVKHQNYDRYFVEIVSSNSSNISPFWGAVGTKNEVSGFDLSMALNRSCITVSNPVDIIKETKQVTQKNKTEEETKMDKIVMSYEGDLATLTAKGAVVYKNNRLVNVGKMYIECKTVEMETQTIEAGSLIVKNGKVYGVASADPVKLVDIATGTVADIIIEEGVGGITTYNKIVNPLEMDNPIVSMTMLTNGSQVDPVSQMAMLNMIQSKQKLAVVPAANQDKILEAIQAQTNLLIALTEKLLQK